jgi:V/A-type H+-transporting ATPase subunit K
MDAMTMAALAKAGGAAALALAAVGSGMGAGTAGMAAIGAWKKCFVQNKAAPFLLLIFIGAPLSQTIYGMILQGNMVRAAQLETYLAAEVVTQAQTAHNAAGVGSWVNYLPDAERDQALESMAQVVGNWPAVLIAGILGGIAMGISALWQGRAGAAGADALAETGQGFGNYLMTIGVVETVALFIMVFIQTALK